MFNNEEIKDIYIFLLILYKNNNCDNNFYLPKNKTLINFYNKISKDFDLIQSKKFISKLERFMLEFNYQNKKTKLYYLINLFMSIEKENKKTIDFWSCYKKFYSMKKSKQIYNKNILN